MLAVIFRVQILIATYPVGLYIGPSSKLTEYNISHTRDVEAAPNIVITKLNFVFVHLTLHDLKC